MISERYKLIAENVHSTVVTAYKPQPRQSTAYQSEAELEAAFGINSISEVKIRIGRVRPVRGAAIQ